MPDESGFTMDLSLILSMVAIIVSVSVSTVTLLLTEFHGPNISLLSVPKFTINDETFDKSQSQKYIPRWLKPKPVTFVFANYGGKAGTILELNLDFVPHKSFEKFFHESYFRFEEPALPVIIREGDNQDLILTSPHIRTIDWKKRALAEALDPNLRIKDMIDKSLQRSKEEFERFCDFLEKSQELGEVSCTITLTKGRFRTRMKSEKLFEKAPVENHYSMAIASLRNCLHRWENLDPTKAELLGEVERSLNDILSELKENLKILKNPIDEQNINSYKLRIDHWNLLHRFWDSDEEKIRWFLIESEKDLKEALTKLYERIIKCDNLVAELRSYGEARTQKHFETANIEREKLRLEVDEIAKRLSVLHKLSVS